MEGESAASGSLHADNVAPVLFGGIVLVRSYNPLDTISLPVPKNLFCTAVLPNLAVNTNEARKILPENITLGSAVEQSSNLAGFIAGLYEEDYELIGKSMVDLFAEPHRSKLIPHYKKLKKSTLESGAIGCGISGSGPSIFALSKSEEIAKTKEKILAVAAGIRKREFSASKGKHCDWCDYKNLICPAWEQ